jgi:hypothetical protein
MVANTTTMTSSEYLGLVFEAFINSQELAELYKQFKTTITIDHIVPGSVSFLASICFIVHIFWSCDGPSMTYHHQLVFELSVADILSSHMYVLASIMVSTELLDYLTPGG